MWPNTYHSLLIWCVNYLNEKKDKIKAIMLVVSMMSTDVSGLHISYLEVLR